jgi:ribose 5-phosphate isomerase B
MWMQENEDGGLRSANPPYGLCRQHNDANVLAMGGRMIGEAVAKECVEVFLSTKFDGGRHQKRVDKLGSC